MKTVEEWVVKFKADGDGEFEPSEMIEYIRTFISDIQQDAINNPNSDNPKSATKADIDRANALIKEAGLHLPTFIE